AESTHCRARSDVVPVAPLSQRLVELGQLQSDEVCRAGAFGTEHDIPDPQPSGRFEAGVVDVSEAALAPPTAHGVRIVDLAVADAGPGHRLGEGQPATRLPIT